MPTYEYRCEDGHTFEVIQRMVEDPIDICEVCGKPVQRVFHPVAVHFKGSGFYNTDYGKKQRGGGGGDSSASSDDTSKSESGESKSSDSKESKPASDSNKAESSKPSETKKTD